MGLFAAFRASDIVKELRALRKVAESQNKMLTQIYTIAWETKQQHQPNDDAML